MTAWRSKKYICHLKKYSNMVPMIPLFGQGELYYTVLQQHSYVVIWNNIFLWIYKKIITHPVALTYYYNHSKECGWLNQTQPQCLSITLIFFPYQLAVIRVCIGSARFHARKGIKLCFWVTLALQGSTRLWLGSRILVNSHFKWNIYQSVHIPLMKSLSLPLSHSIFHFFRKWVH